MFKNQSKFRFIAVESQLQYTVTSRYLDNIHFSASIPYLYKNHHAMHKRYPDVRGVFRILPNTYTGACF